jgi:hypothetical protein
MLSLLLITAGAIAATPVPAARSLATSVQRQPLWWQGNDFQWVRGANYIPGYAYNSYAQWDKSVPTDGPGHPVAGQGVPRSGSVRRDAGAGKVRRNAREQTA